MRTLTNSERILILEDAIKNVQDCTPYYMCGAIENAMKWHFPNIVHSNADYSVINFYFPELKSHKPEQTFMNSTSWFDTTEEDQEKRIEILTAILNQLQS